MMIKAGDTSPSIDVFVCDDDGLPVTGKVYTDFPTVKYAIQGANTSATITLASLAAENTAYSSGGVKERGAGWYRMDLPAAAVATTGKRVTVYGDTTDFHIISPVINVVSEIPGQLADGAITAAKFGSGAIDSAAIAAGAIGSSELADGAITAAKFAAGAIDNTAIAANAIGSSEIADGAITAAKIADSAITNAKIADDAISAGKFDESTAFPIKSADTGDTQIARKGAGTHTLDTIEDKVDAISKNRLVTLVRYATTDGVKAYLKCLLVDPNGVLIDLNVLDAAATCEVTVYQEGSGALFSLDDTAMGTVNANGWFEAEYEEPGFERGVGYVALWTVVADGVTYEAKPEFTSIW